MIVVKATSTLTSNAPVLAILFSKSTNLCYIMVGTGIRFISGGIRRKMKTIREIAEICGVSEQAVRAWCRKIILRKMRKEVSQSAKL